jgi:hypothetical protein
VIKALARLLGLSLIEAALAAALIAAGLLFLAFRLFRRFVTDEPDGLERHARTVLALLAAAAAAGAPKDT